MTRNQLMVFARVGAENELQTLNARRAEILRAFPDLGSPTETPVKVVKTRKHSKISKAARAKMTAGVRRYWRAKKAAAKIAAVAATK